MGVKNTAISVGEIAMKTFVSAIPVGGTLISATYDAVKNNCLSKRNEEWKSVLEERLSKLEMTLEDIGNNELFVTAIVKTTELAAKTAKKEKMELLANSVLHSATQSMDEDKLIIFLSLLDKYTVSHIKILHSFHNPGGLQNVNSNDYYMGAPKTLLFSVYPELQTPWFDKLFKDLYDDGLVSIKDLNTTMSGHGMVEKRTTEIGDEFLRFIMKDNFEECD